ncbi:MAG: NUDIX domain-containing protein [Candidatus Nanoarchaeia archaeon]
MFDAFRARVGVLIINQNKILLLRNTQKVPPTLFLPGGVVRLGERLEDAVKRTVKEQTNLDVEAYKLLYVYDNIKDNGNRHRLDVFFLVQPKDVRILNQNFADLKLDWVNIDLLPSIELNPKILRETILKDWKNGFKTCARYLRQ